VCYIDTEGTFRADRIISIAGHYNLDPNQVLENITVARCFTHDTLATCLIQVAAKFAEERFALLVVDSIMAPFRVDFSGRGELAERQQHLAKVMSRLQKLAEEFNLVVLLTNQVMADPAAALTFAANPPKPIGGHIMAHFSQLRLALRKGRAEQRIMKIYDSPCLPEGDAVFEICDKGIQDAKE
jgi:meiotic recombination protein DMC1